MFGCLVDKISYKLIIISFFCFSINLFAEAPSPDSTGHKPPNGYIRVPANPELGVNEDFYVSKYEMKILGLGDGDQQYGDITMIAESRASGTPWINITQEQAEKECNSLGANYSLISNAEWMTIARNIEAVPANWSDNQTHPIGRTRAKLNIGHSCRKGRMGRDCIVDTNSYSGEALEASENDRRGCFGYNEENSGDDIPKLNKKGWNLYRRTHFLSNGEVIWDFSGNVWCWVDWKVSRARDRARETSEINDEWCEINDARSRSARMENNDFKSLNPDMNGGLNMNGLGAYHASSNDKAGAAMRGGSFMYGSYINGIYALGMDYAPDQEKLPAKIGFRCVWKP